MLPSLIRRAAQQQVPYNIHLNPYKAQRLWPPDFSKITKKQQFRLERKYKRRAKLKWARPGWTKFTKVMQMGTITFTLVYGVLFMDWTTMGGNPTHQPFQDVRKWFFGMTGSIWTKDQIQKQSPVAQPSDEVSLNKTNAR